jgi:hypothetical protein
LIIDVRPDSLNILESFQQTREWTASRGEKKLAFFPYAPPCCVSFFCILDSSSITGAATLILHSRVIFISCRHYPEK